MADWIDEDFRDGYFDGRRKDSPEPGSNRSEAYRHSFEVGRAEIAGKPIPTWRSRPRAEAIRARLSA